MCSGQLITPFNCCHPRLWLFSIPDDISHGFRCAQLSTRMKKITFDLFMNAVYLLITIIPMWTSLPVCLYL